MHQPKNPKPRRRKSDNVMLLNPTRRQRRLSEKQWKVDNEGKKDDCDRTRNGNTKNLTTKYDCRMKRETTKWQETKRERTNIGPNKTMTTTRTTTYCYDLNSGKITMTQLRHTTEIRPCKINTRTTNDWDPNRTRMTTTIHTNTVDSTNPEPWGRHERRESRVGRLLRLWRWERQARRPRFMLAWITHE